MQISLSLSLVAKIFLCWLEHTEKRSIHPVFHVLFFPSFPVHANQSTHTHTLSLSLSLSLSLFSLCYSVGQWCLTGEKRGGCAPARSEFQLPCFGCLRPCATLSPSRGIPRAERVTTGGGVPAVVVLGGVLVLSCICHWPSYVCPDNQGRLSFPTACSCFPLWYKSVSNR